MSTTKTYKRVPRAGQKPAPQKRRQKRHAHKIPRKELEALERQFHSARDQLGGLIVQMLDAVSAALEGRRRAGQALELAQRIADARDSLRTVRK